MEYLMTYGWAILIVIIVAAALFALGVFNPGTFTSSTATGFNEFQVETGGWQLNTSSNDAFLIQLKNAAGSQVTITNITVTIGATTLSNTTDIGDEVLAANEEGTYAVSFANSFSSGSSYTATVEITYTNDNTGFTGFKETGTVTGTVV